MIPEAEPDLSFLDFGSPGRPDTAPTDGDERGDESTPAVRDRGASCFPGAPSTTRTCDLQVRNLIRGSSTYVQLRPLLFDFGYLDENSDSVVVQ